MSHPPINAVTWTLGALAMYMFAFRSWQSYRSTRNPLAQMYFYLGLAFGTGLFFFGVPGLFTQNLHILRITYFLADFFVQVSVQVAVWLFWFLGLRNRIRLRYLLAITLTFSTVLLVLQALTSAVSISQSPHLINYVDQSPVLIMKSVIYLCIAIPIGYFLIRQVPHQLTIRAKLKSFMAGMIFIVIGLAAISNNIFDKGADTPTSAAIVGVIFTVFLLTQLLRPSAVGKR